MKVRKRKASQIQRLGKLVNIKKKEKTDCKDIQSDSKKAIKESKTKGDKLDKEAKKIDSDLTTKIK